jgi:membrane-associated phospholipid phosphatase
VARRIKAPIAAWAGCALALALLALVAYGIDAAQRIDTSLRERFIARGDSGLDSFAGVFVHLGDPPALLLMLAIACAIALWRGRPLDALAAVTVVAGANLTTQLLKVVFSHPRFQAALGADQLGEVPFPSGHVTAATSIAIAFAFVIPAGARTLVALLGACLVAAVGCSVMLLGWHYPSDVLGGILVASGWGFAVLALRRVADGGGSSPRPQVSSRPAISTK